MKLKSQIFYLFFICVFFSNTISAQYYVSGNDPCYLKWSYYKDKVKGDIIFPDYLAEKAAEVAWYREKLSTSININLNAPVKRFPVTLHPTNLMPNGMVTYTPRRMELYTQPAFDNFSTAWLKHLTTHEYRHVAQLSALDCGITHVLSYVLGEQMLGLTAVLVPTYFYEGDAVAAETQFTIFGRGKQPYFNAPLWAEVLTNEKFNPRKYKLGALNQYAPDSYIMGYHLTQYASEKYGSDFWAKCLRFAARNPYLIDPFFFAYRKYGNTKSLTMIREMHAELKEEWAVLLEQENTVELMGSTPRSYTTYSSPVFLDENTVVAIKSDLQRYNRIVSLDLNTNSERVLRDVGISPSGLYVRHGRIFWEEIKPSASWGQKNFSVLYSCSLEGVDRRREAKGSSFHFTPYDEESTAAVYYDECNEPYLVILDANYTETKRFKLLGGDVSVNDIGCDYASASIYCAVVDNKGSSVLRVDMSTGEISYIVEPCYNTITDLRYSGAKLFYTSINSGREELVMYDLQSKQEYQLTESTFGTKDASVALPADKFVAVTRTAEGTSLSLGEISTSLPTEWQKVPSGRFSIEYPSWGVEKIDTMAFSSSEAQAYKGSLKAKKYNKTTRSVNIHSWLPFYIDVDELLDGELVSPALGFSIYSQNLLNNTVLSLSYAYINSYSQYNVKLDYTALPVTLSLDMTYGGKEQSTYNYVNVGGELDQHLEVNTSVSLPLNLSGGGRLRYLTASVQHEYQNANIMEYNYYNITTLGGAPATPVSYATYDIKTGIHKMRYQLTYQNISLMSQQDLQARWGYVVQGIMQNNPFSDSFGSLYALYTKAYVPGLLPNASLSISGATMYQTDNDYSYSELILMPRGTTYYSAVKRSYSGTVDYRAPLCYPNGGLGSLLYFQRISLAGFIDYAHYQDIASSLWQNKHTIGASVIMDVNLLGINNLFEIEFSVYKPSDSNQLGAGFSFSLGL